MAQTVGPRMAMFVELVSNYFMASNLQRLLIHYRSEKEEKRKNLEEDFSEEHDLLPRPQDPLSPLYASRQHFSSSCGFSPDQATSPTFKQTLSSDTLAVL